MSTRRMMGIYNNLYNQINEYYNEEFLSIQKACNRVNISTSKYYDLCKKLGRPSVAIEGNIEPSPHRTLPTVKRGTKETVKKKEIVKKETVIKKGTKETKPKKDVAIKKGTKETKLKKVVSKKTLKPKTIPEKKKSTVKLTKSKNMKGGNIKEVSSGHIPNVNSTTNDNNSDDRNDDRFDDRMIDKPDIILDNDIINIFIKTNNDSHDSEASMTGLTEMIDTQ